MYLSIQAARSQQGGVQCVSPVGGHNDLDVGGLVKAIHLVEQLQQDALHLAIGSSLRVEALGSNGVNLVNEHNRRLILARQPEHITHHARTLRSRWTGFECGAVTSNEMC